MTGCKSLARLSSGVTKLEGVCLNALNDLGDLNELFSFEEFLVRLSGVGSSNCVGGRKILVLIGACVLDFGVGGNC